MWLPKVGPGNYRVGSGQKSEGSRWVFGVVNVTTRFRPSGTLCQVLFHPKDMVPYRKKTNVVDQVDCGQGGEQYVGEPQQHAPETSGSRIKHEWWNVLKYVNSANILMCKTCVRILFASIEMSLGMKAFGQSEMCKRISETRTKLVSSI